MPAKRAAKLAIVPLASVMSIQDDDGGDTDDVNRHAVELALQQDQERARAQEDAEHARGLNGDAIPVDGPIFDPAAHKHEVPMEHADGRKARIHPNSVDTMAGLGWKRVKK